MLYVHLFALDTDEFRCFWPQRHQIAYADVSILFDMLLKNASGFIVDVSLVPSVQGILIENVLFRINKMCLITSEFFKLLNLSIA